MLFGAVVKPPPSPLTLTLLPLLEQNAPSYILNVASMAGYDGTKLRYACWEATRGPKRGTVCIFPGRGEYIEKYFEAVADLRRRGFGVAIMDWRGQGGSERRLSNQRKGHVVGFTEYDRDLAIFMNTIVLPNLPHPLPICTQPTRQDLQAKMAMKPSLPTSKK